MAFRERLNSSTATCSSVIDKVNTLMTKTGVAVTAIFVLTMGYNISYYCLGKIGVFVYVLNTPLQKIGLLLSAFNSVANPFVYVLLMPAFRDSLRKTFHLPSLRCHVVSKSDVIGGSRSVGTSSDTNTGRTELVTNDGRETPGSLTISPNNLQLDITPVTHIV